jgi:hypothetical protein
MILKMVLNLVLKRVLLPHGHQTLNVMAAYHGHLMSSQRAVLSLG